MKKGSHKTKLTSIEKYWIMYDCGNSAYSLAITTALFPVYFAMIKGDNSMDLGYFNTFASLCVALLSPILGTIADYKNFKKRFLIFFVVLGICTTGLLAVVPMGQWFVLAMIYVLSSVGFAGANIFYDAFLVDVTSDERMDRVSSQGFAYGYIASVLPFVLTLFLVNKFGDERQIGYQIGFVITALWWGLFTLPLLRHVKQKHYIEPEQQPIRKSFQRLLQTFKDIRQYKLVVTFLIAYFLYIDGVDTVIKMAVPYTQSTLRLESMHTFVLLGILLIINIIAFPFALLYGKLAKRYSAKKMIVVAILTYIATSIFAFFMSDLWQLFILGGLIGSAQGGIQALSRSYYARIIPKNKSNEFFGFYNIFGKFAAIVGPFIMALTTTLTGEPRYSILSIIPLFVLGLIVFLKLPEKPDHIYQ